MIEYIDLTIDFTNRNARVGGVTLDRVTTRNYDTAIKFRIEIIGHVLDDTYDVKIVSKYRTSGFNVMTTLGDKLEIVDGKLIYTPKVNLITEADCVRNYLYLSKDGLGLDMAQFNNQVDVSQIGEITLEIRQAYDESYETLLAEFEQALEDYKLTLPQADSVRAEIDVVLNQFGMDSQAKLSQYDTDAQQVIADNQTAFGVAESGRQDTYEQAETDRNQASNQAVVDWEQGADALLETVEGDEATRVTAETARKTAETDRASSETTRKTNETTRISNENARKSAEVIRLANETGRVNAENIRSDFYEGFDGRLGDLESDRVVLKNELINGGFVSTVSPWLSALSTSVWSADFVEVTPTGQYGGILQSRTTTEYGGKVLYIHGMFNAKVPSVNIISNSNPGTASVFHSGSGNWERMSFIQKQPTGAARLRIEVRDDAISPIEKFQIKYVAAIDLTAIFGAGNEPTKSEMDELIKITGYFEEITPTQKQLLTWQLKFMRQNRNALIALGGTII